MKKYFVYIAACLSLMIMASCDNDEPVNNDSDENKTIYGAVGHITGLIESADNSLEINSCNGVYFVEVPADGGRFEFRLGSMAQIIGSQLDDPKIKEYDFTLHKCSEVVWDSNRVPRNLEEANATNGKEISRLNNLDSEFDTQFGHHTAIENGFILSVNPNTSKNERCFALETQHPLQPPFQLYLIQRAY